MTHRRHFGQDGHGYFRRRLGADAQAHGPAHALLGLEGGEGLGALAVDLDDEVAGLDAKARALDQAWVERAQNLCLRVMGLDPGHISIHNLSREYYQLLEEITDSANHCGKLVLSLARKEA